MTILYFGKEATDLSSAKALKPKILSIVLACAVLSGCAYRVKTEKDAENDLFPMASVENAKTEGAVMAEAFYDAELIKMNLPPSELEQDLKLYTTIANTPIILRDFIVVPVYRYYTSSQAVVTGSGPVYEAVEFKYAVYNLDGEFISYLEFDNEYTDDAIFCEDAAGNIVAFYSYADMTDDYSYSYYNIYATTFSALDGLRLNPPVVIYQESGSLLIGALMLDNGNILLSLGDKICVVDMLGQFLCGYSLTDYEWCSGLWEEDGRYYAEILSEADEGTGGVLLELAIEPSGEFSVSKTGKNTDNIAGMKVFQNSNGIYAATRNALGRLDLETGEFSRLLDWNQTDADRRLIDKGNIRVLEEGALSQTLTVLPVVEEEDPVSHDYQPSENEGNVVVDESFEEASRHTDVTDPSSEGSGQTRLLIATTMNNVEGKIPCLLKLTPSENHPHASQNVIWIGGVDISSGPLMAYISEYNRNPENSIWLKIYDYADFSFYDSVAETDRAYEAALENMAAQIRSGIGPDIIVGTGDSGVFDNGNCLTDLNGYVDGIHGINREEYFGSVFDAFETNGKLYQIPLSFQLYSILGNTVLADGKSNLTYHDYTTAGNIFQGEFTLFSYYPSSILLSLFVKAETGTWIDYEHGTSNIDRDSLIEMLEVIRTNTQDIGYDELDEYLMFYEPSVSESADALYSGESGFSVGRITSLSDFALSHMIEGSFAWYGFPGGGMTSVVRSDMTCGIASCSTQKELAWNVILYMLSEEVQKDIGKSVEYSGGFDFDDRARFPVNVHAFERNCADLASGSNDLYICMSDMYGSGEEVMVDLNTVEKNEAAFIEFMKKPLRRYIFDIDVVQIVFEETQKYIDGEVQVTQAADNIRRRLNVLASG